MVAYFRTGAHECRRRDPAAYLAADDLSQLGEVDGRRCGRRTVRGPFGDSVCGRAVRAGHRDPAHEPGAGPLAGVALGPGAGMDRLQYHYLLGERITAISGPQRAHRYRTAHGHGAYHGRHPDADGWVKRVRSPV